MRNTDTFRQYIWLVNTIERHKRISFDLLGKLWIDYDLNERKPLSRTTFHRLKIAIEDMFGIRIECDSKDGYQYYIANSEILNGNSTQNWMLRTLTVNSILLEGLSIKDHLLLEEIPQGTEYLQTIISAIKCRHIISLTYRKFDDNEGIRRPIEPYCLKVFRQRWYLLGKNKDKNDRMSIYALDRVLELTETDIPFIMDMDFDAEQFFRNYFGVIIGEKDSSHHIILLAHGKMVKYLETLPLHHSQKLVKKTDYHADFEYFLIPTKDFRQAILKEGDELEVIEPIKLREMIRGELMNALQRYQ